MKRINIKISQYAWLSFYPESNVFALSDGTHNEIEIDLDEAKALYKILEKLLEKEAGIVKG